VLLAAVGPLVGVELAQLQLVLQLAQQVALQH
jgi:hypothetical protein